MSSEWNRQAAKLAMLELRRKQDHVRSVFKFRLWANVKDTLGALLAIAVIAVMLLVLSAIIAVEITR